MNEGLMNERHLIRLFKLNPHMYLHGFDENGKDKAEHFRKVCQRLMKFSVERVSRGLENVLSSEGNHLSRLSYVFKVHDLLLAEQKVEYLNAPVASNIKQAMKSLFS
jgi:hypothetical protein